MPEQDPPETEPNPAVERYAALELADGELVVYDAENHRAWVQSDAGVALADCA